MDDYNWADVKNTSNTTDQDMEMDEDENDQAIKENKRSFEAVRNLNRNREKQLTRHDSKPRNNSRQNFVDSRNKSHKSPRRNSNPHRQTNSYPAQQGQKPTQYAPRGPPNNARAMRGFEEEVQPQMTEAACPNSSNQRFSKLVAQNILSTEKTPPETPKQLHLPPISINLPFDSFLQENDNMTTCAPAFLEDYALLCNMASPKMTVTLLPDLDNLDRNDHLLIDLSSLFKGSLPTPLCGDCVDATLSWNDTRNVRLPFSTCAPQGVDRKLTSLLVPQSCIEDVTNIIDSYRTHDLRFHYLHDLFNKNHLSDKLQAHYLENVIPGMVKLALRLTDLFKKPIPRLLHGTAGSVTMSQEQAACLLANAFFCTFPEPPFDLRWRKTYFNFERMYIIGRRCKIEKIKCLFHYFDAVLQNMPDGLITIRQHHLEEHVEDQFLTMDWKLCDLEVHEKGRIEDTEDKMIEIDFANQYIGGGVLNAGCVQEEIRFVLSPELLVSMLICERMDDRTAISIIGSWRFNDYTGYGDDFKFARRDFPRVSERDKFKRCLSEVMAINAMKFGQKPEYQFEERPIYRELVKAYCAFAHRDDLNRPIATGNWGCGVYRGNKQMKSLIQLIAASAHRRTKMVYFTFDDVDLSNRLRNLHLKLTGNGVSIERLLRMVLSFKEFSETDKDTDLFTYIDSQLDVLIDRK